MICSELLNELESDSIDEQNEFWHDFDNVIRTKLEEDGVTCSPRQPIKQKRKNQLHVLIVKVYLERGIITVKGSETKNSLTKFIPIHPELNQLNRFSSG